MKPAILSLNSGSSSLRFALYAWDDSPAPLLTGKFDRIGTEEATVEFEVDGHIEKQECQLPDQAVCIPLLLARLEHFQLRAIGHRVVHGGPHFSDPHRVDAAMLDELRRICSFAPNHLPSTIALMEIFATQFPSVPQVACFDTAFHHDMPRVAQLLPIPRRYAAQGVVRYGFHGLSCAYLMEELKRLGDPAATHGRVILAHLGHGASMTAVLNGESMDTSMGFTPASGLVMGTRSGDLDPGLIHYLAQTEGMTTAQFQHMVNHESGLRGISMISSDMRKLLALEATDGRAADAVATFCHEAKKRIGSYAAVLGGVDTLVFAGGIGENVPSVRARICAGLDFLGIQMDAIRNAESAAVISTADGVVKVRVIHTNEELMIVRSVRRLLKSEAPSK